MMKKVIMCIVLSLIVFGFSVSSHAFMQSGGANVPTSSDDEDGDILSDTTFGSGPNVPNMGGMQCDGCDADNGGSDSGEPCEYCFADNGGEPCEHCGPDDNGGSVPEPATLILLGSGLAGLIIARKKRS